MTLEEQVETLANLGVQLNEGISIDDLLYSFDRRKYERRAFDILLFMMGSEVEREPWGRSFSSQVWNFDTECVYGPGSYTKIVERLCLLAGMPELVTDLRDDVDLHSGEAWLRYTIDGKERHWTVEVMDDWVDSMTLSYVMADIERDGKHFYSKDNGQAMILFYLDTEAAKELNRLSDHALTPVLLDS